MVLQLIARHCESAEGCACWQVMVSDEEPQENAVKRFRREVMNAGLTLEVCSQLLRSRCRASWLLLGGSWPVREDVPADGRAAPCAVTAKTCLKLLGARSLR